jgi:hypothetical protein
VPAGAVLCFPAKTHSSSPFVQQLGCEKTDDALSPRQVRDKRAENSENQTELAAALRQLRTRRWGRREPRDVSELVHRGANTAGEAVFEVSSRGVERAVAVRAKAEVVPAPVNIGVKTGSSQPHVSG